MHRGMCPRGCIQGKCAYAFSNSRYPLNPLCSAATRLLLCRHHQQPLLCVCVCLCPPLSPFAQSGYCVVTSHRLLWVDAVAAPASGRSCHLPLDTIHSVHKRTQFGLNVMNPKVRLEVKLFVDRNFKVANSKCSCCGTHCDVAQAQGVPLLGLCSRVVCV